MLARFRELKRSDRLRVIGWAVLAGGLVAAAVSYWIDARSAEPALDDSTALGYSRAMQHDVGAMMGRFGLMLSNWQDALSSPLGRAAIIAVCAALLAGYFFRVAWVLDDQERQ